LIVVSVLAATDTPEPRVPVAVALFANTAHSEKWVVVWDTTRVLVSTLPPVLGNTHAEVPLSQYANRIDAATDDEMLAE